MGYEPARGFDQDEKTAPCDVLSYSVCMETSQLPESTPDSVNQAAMAELRRVYDKRLTCLNEASSADLIDEFMNQDVKLHGKVNAGERF